VTLASLVSSWRVAVGFVVDMDRLRETIELLSKLLYENASLKVRAEVFRAAKFNNVEAVSVDRLLQIYKHTTRADE